MINPQDVPIIDEDEFIDVENVNDPPSLSFYVPGREYKKYTEGRRGRTGSIKRSMEDQPPSREGTKITPTSSGAIFRSKSFLFFFFSSY